jgi:hypothetical protein
MSVPNDPDKDKDLAVMSAEELRAEVRKLRSAIREQRDQKGHDLCWFVPELWDVLPEKARPKPDVPPWPEFIQRCAAFRQSLDEM